MHSFYMYMSVTYIIFFHSFLKLSIEPIPLDLVAIEGFYYVHVSFISNSQLQVSVHMNRGSHLKYRWYWGDNDTEVTTDPIANHRYRRPGVYTVSVIIFNARDTCNTTVTVNIQRTVSSLNVFGPETVTRNTTDSWVMDLGTIGTDACYIVSIYTCGWPSKYC